MPKGHTNNPNGRPKKGKSLTEALEARLDRFALAEKLIELAMSGDIQAIKYIYDRVDGRPTETVNHGNKDGEAFILQVEVIGED